MTRNQKEWEYEVMRIYPEGVTPECFNGASSQSFTWIPAKSMRE